VHIPDNRAIRDRDVSVRKVLATNEISPDGVECELNNLNGFVGMLEARNSALDSPYCPSCVYGIDFSGAKKAGTKIWIATATIVRDTLKIEDCLQAKDLPSSATERGQCLGALRHFISTRKACAFGLDFPFGLPNILVEANSWEEFILSFSNRYPGPEEFRDTCWVAAGNRELRRDTDKVSRTPFSPYNRRLYRQTYYGIHDVLAPLVREQLVYVLPMQKASPGRPWLFEVCPASTLQQMGLRLTYKGGSKANSAARVRILKGIEATSAMVIQTSALRSRTLDDRYGDALDSVIAAFTTFRALRNLAPSFVPRTDAYALEGYVYV